MPSTASENEPIYSTLGADPDFGELVEMFVDEMPDRIATLEAALRGEDLEALGRASHQMKGAAGSYGFQILTQLAAAAEAAAKESGSIESVREPLETLVDACRRVRAGAPD